PTQIAVSMWSPVPSSPPPRSPARHTLSLHDALPIFESAGIIGLACRMEWSLDAIAHTDSSSHFAVRCAGRRIGARDAAARARTVRSAPAGLGAEAAAARLRRRLSGRSAHAVYRFRHTASRR